MTINYLTVDLDLRDLAPIKKGYKAADPDKTVYAYQAHTYNALMQASADAENKDAMRAGKLPDGNILLARHMYTPEERREIISEKEFKDRGYYIESDWSRMFGNGQNLPDVIVSPSARKLQGAASENTTAEVHSPAPV